ncbi:MAG: OmpA family protein [Bacteroidota bacterium]
MIFRFFILIIFFNVSVQTVLCQSDFDISKNSKYYVKCVPSDKISANKKEIAYDLKVYHIPSQNAVFSYSFYIRQFDKLKSVNISPDGKTVAVISYSETKMIDILSQAVIKKFSGSKKIIFPSYDNFFLVDEGTIAAYDCFSGKQLVVYEKSDAGITIGRKTWISDDEKYLIIQYHPNFIKLWKIGEAKLMKSFSGSSICFDYVKKTATVFRGSKIYTYDSDNFVLKFKQDLNKLTKRFVNEQKRNHNEVILYPSSYIPSLNGRFLFMPYKCKNEDKKNLLLVSTQRDELIPVNSGDLGEFDDFSWVSDTSLLIYNNEKVSKLLTISDHIQVTDIRFRNKEIAFNKVSPNYNYKIKPLYDFLNRKITVKSTMGFPKWKIYNAKFISFTPDNQYIIIEKGKRGEGVVFANKDTVFYPFKDSIVQVKEIAQEDIEAPNDYKSFRINSFKHIKERSDTSTFVNLVMKSMEVQDSMVSVNVHLIDDSGIYYYGAGTEEWKKIWCNFIIKDINNKIEQVADFEVIEHSEIDTVPVAIAVVMDHSGSMGSERTTHLQLAAKLFIQKKERKDAIAIIKYDSKVRIESYPESDPTKLLNDLKINGFGIFGGTTSLLDATNTGISVLKNSKKYPRKAIMVLTDGNENSSFISRAEVIKRANSNNINIHTIAYGPNVSMPYLKYISDNTEGSTYRIYRKGDFDWIFNDIYIKVKNYYQIKFKIEDYGKFLAILKICSNNSSDTLAISFDRGEPSQSKKVGSKEKEHYQFCTVPRNDEVNKTLSICNDITDFSKVKIGSASNFNGKGTVEEVNDTLDITVIEDDFEKIEFPDIKFVFDRPEISLGTDKKIENIVEFMNKYEQIKIEIGGHTDDFGDDNYNLKLSMERSETVKMILVKMGIDENRIEAVGYGETQPLVTNDSEDNRLKNRRVEFNIIH